MLIVSRVILKILNFTEITKVTGFKKTMTYLYQRGGLYIFLNGPENG